MNTRISTDLGDEKLMKLLKMEAQESHTTVKRVLIKALESYFYNRLELKALQKAQESIFEEWNDPRDADYDEI